MVDVIVFEEISIPIYLAYIINIKKRKLYYFNTTRCFSALLKMVPETALGVARIDFHASEINDGREDSLVYRIAHHDVGAACAEIINKMLRSNNAIGAISSFIGDLSKDKISRYCISNSSIPLTRRLIYINAIQWHFSIREKNTIAGITFITNTTPYISILQAYASKKGNIVLRNKPDLGGRLKRLVKASIFLFIKPVKLFITSITQRPSHEKYCIWGNGPYISLIYANYRDITFNLNEKNDFFWLPNSGIDNSRLIVYFDEAHVRLDKDAIEEFKRRKINYAVLSDRIRLLGSDNYWVPNLKYFGRLVKINFAVCRAILKDILTGNTGSLYFMKDYFEFSHNYAYWHDFFSSLRIKININQHDSLSQSIPMHLALENTGGTSVSYQRSDCSVPFFLGGSTADIYFAFGAGYLKPFKESQFIVNTLLISGYLTDYVFTGLRGPALQLRQALTSKGAKYIISFFDESSSDDRFSIRKNIVLAEMYREIIEKVMGDGSLGLIIKSKRPCTLRKRLGKVAKLLDALCATGRCVVLDKGYHVSSIYPAQAAQASDISIGLLSGGTTILESVLSGTPGLYLDVERLYAYEQYRTGKDIFVFNSMDKLLAKVDELRKDKDALRQLDGLHEVINSKDPFRDGKASERMGTYFRWLLECFDKNSSRELALERANYLYGDKWGKDKVLKI